MNESSFLMCVPDELTAAERARYARHLMLPEMGEEGQKRLLNASVMVIGAGGLGSPALLYLAAAGIGRIGIIDDDRVDITNLQRQVIHATASVGSLKVESAAIRIKQLNPEVEVVEHEVRLNVENALELLAGYDVIIDGTDNFPTRYTVSDACEILGTPWVFGSIHRFEGQVSVFNHEGGPNYRDLFPSAPPPELAPNCAEAGVLGVLPGIVGSIQAAEAIKLILGIGEPLSGQLLVIDAKTMKMRALTFERDANREVVREMSEELVMAACASQQSEPEPALGEVLEITPADFVQRKTSGWNPFLLDVRRATEESIVSLPGTDLRITHISVPSRSEEIPQDRDIVVYCRVGGRSNAVAHWLGQAGWNRSRIWNMVGGLHLWADQVDSTVPKY